MGGVLFLVSTLRSVDLSLTTLLAERRHNEVEFDMTSSWHDAAGITHTVTTARLENELPADWAARHKAAVDALKALFPPVA